MDDQWTPELSSKYFQAMLHATDWTNAQIQWIGLRENLRENPIFSGKIHGFRLRFSQQNQSIHRFHRIPVGPMPSALGLFSSKVNSETAGMATRRQLKRALSGA